MTHPLYPTGPWTDAEDAKLIAIFRAGGGFPEMVAALEGRSRRGVEHRMTLLRAEGTISGRMPGWTRAEAEPVVAITPEADGSKRLLVAMLRYGAKNDHLLSLPADKFLSLCSEHRVAVQVERRQAA